MEIYIIIFKLKFATQFYSDTIRKLSWTELYPAYHYFVCDLTGLAGIATTSLNDSFLGSAVNGIWSPSEGGTGTPFELAWKKLVPPFPEPPLLEPLILAENFTQYDLVLIVLSVIEGGLVEKVVLYLEKLVPLLDALIVENWSGIY